MRAKRPINEHSVDASPKIPSYRTAGMTLYSEILVKLWLLSKQIVSRSLSVLYCARKACGKKPFVSCMSSSSARATRKKEKFSKLRVEMRDTQFGLGHLDGFVVGFDRSFSCALAHSRDEASALA